MDAENTGARTRRTRALIEKTYLDFLEEGNKGVNVAELCRRAHINRGTFYNHFDDIADVRAEKVREDRLRELGYHVVRLTWADLDDLQVVRRKVLRGVALAA